MSKATITILGNTDLAGRHNTDSETHTRLIEGGSWKRQRIVLIIPSAEMISAKVMITLMGLGFPPNQGVFRMLAMGMEVGDAYSQAVESVLADPTMREFEYILTVESDNLPPDDGVIKLLESMEAHPEFSCISGLYFCKGPGAPAQIWGDPKDPLPNFRPQVPIPETVQECCGTGMGFALWRIAMFKDTKIKRPLFRTISGKEGFGTQDLSFWTEARKWGYRCAVDTRVKVGHIDIEGKFGQPGLIW
jgi:hypothetical protein